MSFKFKVASVGLFATFFVAPNAGAAITASFSNPAPITINDATSPGVLMPASPFPSTVDVGSIHPLVTGILTSPVIATVTLRGVTHESPADLYVRLVAPRSSGVLLDNAGGATTPVTNATITFITGRTRVPFEGPLVTGTYAPTAYSLYGNGTGGEVRPSFDPGAWSLYVGDNDPGGAGVIAGGFSVDITYTPDNRVHLGAAKIDKKKGTAALAVTVLNAGTITLGGGTVKASTIAATGPGTYVLPVNPSRRASKRLKKKRKVGVKAVVRFTPTGGSGRSLSKKFTLKKSAGKKRK